jgi:lambda family phage portal protein
MNHREHENYIKNWKEPEKPIAKTKQYDFQANYSRNYGQTLGYDTRQSGGKTRYGLSRYQSLLILDHYALRQNARKASFDSIQARVILKRETDSVIGNGLKIDPTPDSKILGISQEEAELWADDVKDRFNLWATSKDSDLTGRNNFYQNTRFYSWQYGRDGDVFIRLSYSDNKKLLNPLQISFIDPNQVRNDEFTFSSGPEVQDDGIIKDDNGKEIGYKVWINNQKNPGRYEEITIDAFDKETGRPIILHGFDPEWAGQSRGIPELGNALQEFEDITSFETATVKKAITGASMNFIVENDQQDPSDLGLQQMDNGIAGPPTETDPSAPVQTPRNLGAEGVTACNLHEQTMTEPGTTIYGASQGDKLKEISSLSPPEHAGDFVDSKFSYLAASKSMPISIAKMIFGKSHSASRGELGLYENVREIKKDDIVSDFLSWVYFAWLSEEIAAGRIKAPGFSDPILRAAWLSANWRMKPLPDVDPLKTKQMVKLAIEMGLTDFDSEAIAHNGSSGKANRAKVARQLEELATDPFELKTQQTNPEQPEEEKEDE